MYRSMIVGEGEKIRSIPLKHILIFTTLIICAGLMFKFLFVPVLQGMNRNQVHAGSTKKQDSTVVKEKKEVIKDDGYYKIIGIVDGLWTPPRCLDSERTKKSKDWYETQEEN